MYSGSMSDLNTGDEERHVKAVDVKDGEGNDGKHVGERRVGG